MKGKLDPEFEVEIQFPFAELFDPDDPLGQWVANLARGTNDLLVAHRRLDETFASEPPTGHEAIYDIKQVASNAFDLIEFIRESQASEIQDFLGRLSEDLQQKRERAFELLNAPAPPNKKAFKAELASARDQASHYSKIDHKLLVAALKRLGEPEADGPPSIGKVRIGKTQKDFYADFASILDYQLFIPTKGEDLEPLKKFLLPLRELAGALINFAAEAVLTYIYEHKELLQVEQLSTD